MEDMKKLIKQLKRYNKKAQKHRALYIKWLDKEQRAAWALQSTYYKNEEGRNEALEMLHEYGLSREVMQKMEAMEIIEDDENEDNAERG